MSIDILFASTVDHLKLQGIHYDPGNRKICVLLIHGMSGNFIENHFGHELGKTLSDNGIGCIYSHNRGYGFINDILTDKRDKDGGYETQRHGATYERFNESVFDIDAWVKETQKLGYQKIILMGHSLGCNKIVHFLYKRKSAPNIIGVILGSPPDMVGAAKHDSGLDEYKRLVSEAEKNVAEGNPRKLLGGFLFGGWIQMSSLAFLDSSVDNSPADIFPIVRNPEKFEEFTALDLPMLCLVGEKDEVLLRPLEEYFSILKSKATSCPKFDTSVIKNATHCYDFFEQEVASIVSDWVRGFV